MDCVSKSVRAVIIEAGGFAEIGGEGSMLQEKIRSIAKKERIRIVGPNCAGIVNTHKNLITTFVSGSSARYSNMFFLEFAIL